MEKLMKVYLDYQIYAYMKSDSDALQYFKNKSEGGWEYYLSTAHLEEFYHNELTEPDSKKGIAKELENFARCISNKGIITPEINGLRLDSFDAAMSRIKYFDTQEAVMENSKYGFRARNSNGVNPAELFKGISVKPEDEYKEVWNTEIAKAAMSLSIFDIEGSYDEVKDRYTSLEATMTSLFSVLSAIGYKRDKTEATYTSGEYDINHAILSTYCDIFVTADSKFFNRYKAVAYYLGIPIKIMKYNPSMKKIEE